MISIVKATAADTPLIADIASRSFIESHHTSAPMHEIDNYIKAKYDQAVLREELEDPANIYYIIYTDKKPAGYSKIVFNSPHTRIAQQNITKLERIYLLQEFYGLKLGAELFSFNLRLSKSNDQSGMWLYVWEKNDRAIAFYERAGFKIIGHGDFRLTATHSNPNHIMFLEY